MWYYSWTNNTQIDKCLQQSLVEVKESMKVFAQLRNIEKMSWRDGFSTQTINSISSKLTNISLIFQMIIWVKDFGMILKYMIQQSEYYINFDQQI